MKEIAENYWKKIHTKINEFKPQNDHFLDGNLALTWYYYHTWKATKQIDYATKAQILINQVFENINSNPQLAGASFANGMAGFAYTVTILSKDKLIDINIDEELEDVDEYLYQQAIEWINDDYIDFLYGATGIIHYFNERLDNPKIYDYTNDLVERFFYRGIIDKKGIRFKSYVASIEEKEKIDFSLSHGLVGFMLVLLNTYENGLQNEIIPNFVSKAIDYIFSYKRNTDFDNEHYSYFPNSVNETTNEVNYKNRLAWCYGDLNVVLLLFRYAKLFNDKNIEKQASLIGTSTLMRLNTNATLITDAHFCHGASGVAQFYKTLFEISDIDAFQKGYEQWIDKLLVFIDNGLVNNNYSSIEGNILDGYSGIALTLLSYFKNETLFWQKTFLL
jgi:lantibiotic biosynthesis protein